MKGVDTMSYIKRLLIDKIVDLYYDGVEPSKIAHILSIPESDVLVITDELKIES